jgi:SOS-response transcriptional repressor LexA
LLDFSEIIEKLKDLLSQQKQGKKIFDKDIATALNLTSVNLATLKKRNSIPYSNILDFCALKKISINWLLYNQDPSSLIQTTDKYWIRYYPHINVSAGGGAFENNQEANWLQLPEYMIQIIGGSSNIKNIEAINVIGDSMEPTLHDGNIIFIDRSKQEIINNSIYAFLENDNLYVKRIQKNKDNTLFIVSDNSYYNTRIIEKQYIKIIGKVISLIGRVY